MRRQRLSTPCSFIRSSGAVTPASGSILSAFFSCDGADASAGRQANETTPAFRILRRPILSLRSISFHSPFGFKTNVIATARMGSAPAAVSRFMLIARLILPPTACQRSDTSFPYNHTARKYVNRFISVIPTVESTKSHQSFWHAFSFQLKLFYR
jgi:hypothetical protein